MWFVTVCSRWQNGPFKVVCGEEDDEGEESQTGRRQTSTTYTTNRIRALEH